MSERPPDALPPYAYVPGGPWPHPARLPRDRPPLPAASLVPGRWAQSIIYMHGFELFNAGYYWEAHEAWEALWHAHGRTGPTAWVLQALIKLAAAGVKVREGRAGGVRTHAARAAQLLERAREAGGDVQLGLDLPAIAAIARDVAVDPPVDHSPAGAAVVRVFAFRIQPETAAASACHDAPARDRQGVERHSGVD